MYPLRCDQEKVVFFSSPGAEQVLLMLKVKILQSFAMTRGGYRFLRGLKLELLEKPFFFFFKKEGYEYKIRYRALERALRIKLH